VNRPSRETETDAHPPAGRIGIRAAAGDGATKGRRRVTVISWHEEATIEIGTVGSPTTGTHREMTSAQVDGLDATATGQVRNDPIATKRHVETGLGLPDGTNRALGNEAGDTGTVHPIKPHIETGTSRIANPSSQPAKNRITN